MSINSLRLNAARRRAFRPSILTVFEPIENKPAGVGGIDVSPARMVGYNPDADKYVVQTASGKRLNTRYIPGSNPLHGGFNWQVTGIVSQGTFIVP